MWKYILKRILMLIPIVIGISILVFLLMSLSGTSPGRMILGPEASQTDIEKIEHELGLDKSLPAQYGDYFIKAVQGDLGNSYKTGDTVISTIKIRFPVTLKLSLAAMLLAAVVGIPVGILSATKQKSIFDKVTTVSTLVLYSIPPFCMGILLIFVFAFKLDLLPSFGIDEWQGYILPAIALSVNTMCAIIRTGRSTLLEEVRQDYIRSARGKGVPERAITMKHALPNAIIPVITVTGVNFGYLLGGTVVIESVFSLPGMGTMLITAIRTSDTPLVMGGVILLAAAFSIVNLLVDVIYAFVDPRIKAQYKGR
ncbi:ABC transporter permease [Christensenellaceae bacterium OttesenSCG-928-M15]|nr:ABC transporter permease [Christensenellaceae bacterium OttesenSCG-928-M15]